MNLDADRTQADDAGTGREPGRQGGIADFADRCIDERQLIPQQDQSIGRIEERPRHPGTAEVAAHRTAIGRDRIGPIVRALVKP